jgi:hypothetical protein
MNEKKRPGRPPKYKTEEERLAARRKQRREWQQRWRDAMKLYRKEGDEDEYEDDG